MATGDPGPHPRGAWRCAPCASTGDRKVSKVTDVAVTEAQLPAPRTPVQAHPEPKIAISVIVPTRNEAGNVDALLGRLAPVLAGVGSEVVFVDDSDDETPDRVRDWAGRGVDPQVRLIHRPPGQRVRRFGHRCARRARRSAGGVGRRHGWRSSAPPGSRDPVGPDRRSDRRGHRRGQSARGRGRLVGAVGSQAGRCVRCGDQAGQGGVPGSAPRRLRPDERVLRRAPVGPGAVRAASGWLQDPHGDPGADTRALSHRGRLRVPGPLRGAEQGVAGRGSSLRQARGPAVPVTPVAPEPNHSTRPRIRGRGHLRAGGQHRGDVAARRSSRISGSTT